jgi:hypothetical protein
VNPRAAEWVAVAQVVGSVGMFGVIWIVQLVHYCSIAWTVRAGLAIAMLVAVLR